MRVSESFLQMVDDWRRRQIDVPSRAEAIRRMVELAIKANKKPETDRLAPNSHDETRWPTWSSSTRMALGLVYGSKTRKKIENAVLALNEEP